MKYIRTENGIFRRYKNSTIIDNIFYYPDNGEFPEYRREPILKQADTIEELCDGIIVLSPGHISPLSIYFVGDKRVERLAKDGFKAFGFILTDKGLIYVAQMNDNGELKLLI